MADSSQGLTMAKNVPRGVRIGLDVGGPQRGRGRRRGPFWRAVLPGAAQWLYFPSLLTALYAGVWRAAQA